MSNTTLKKFKLDIADLSDVERKAKNLLRRSYCFEGKNIIIATPIYQADGADRNVRIYDTDKLSYLVNLRDALYLRKCLYRKNRDKVIKVITFEEDPCLLKRALGRIDCLILSHKFTALDKGELISELEDHFDCKNMMIMELK